MKSNLTQSLPQGPPRDFLQYLLEIRPIFCFLSTWCGFILLLILGLLKCNAYKVAESLNEEEKLREKWWEGVEKGVYKISGSEWMGDGQNMDH